VSDEELIASLRGKGFSFMEKAADRIEALTAKVKLMDDLDVINGEKIEALTEQLEAARADAKEAEAYAEELDAKLGLAMWLLIEAAVQLEEGKIKTRRNRAAIIWNLLDEMGADNAP
jgi:hypothetical protein